MCTYRIDDTSNEYYYAVMSMRTIFSLRQGRDKPKKPYYRWFKSSIFIDEVENAHPQHTQNYIEHTWEATTMMVLESSRQYASLFKPTPIIFRCMKQLKKQYPTGYKQLNKDPNCCIKLFMMIQEINDTTTTTCTTQYSKIPTKG